MKLIRLPAVIERVQLSAMTIWRREKAGTFPRRVKLGQNTVAWVEKEIEAWMIDRIKERDDGEADRAAEDAAPEYEAAGDGR
jgi:prophage regulatory protein